MSVILGKSGFKIFTLLTATVTISAPDDSMAARFSLKSLNFPLPIINLDLYSFPAK